MKPISYKQETGDRERICTQEDPPPGSCSISERCLSWHNEVFCLRLEDKETNFVKLQGKIQISSSTLIFKMAYVLKIHVKFYLKLPG